MLKQIGLYQFTLLKNTKIKLSKILLLLQGGGINVHGSAKTLKQCTTNTFDTNMLHSSHRPRYCRACRFCYPLFCKRLVGLMVIILLYCIHRRRSRGIMGIYAMDAIGNHPNVFMINAHTRNYADDRCFDHELQIF